MGDLVEIAHFHQPPLPRKLAKRQSERCCRLLYCPHHMRCLLPEQDITLKHHLNRCKQSLNPVLGTLNLTRQCKLQQPLARSK